MADPGIPLPTDMELIQQYHQIGVLLNERLRKGRRFVTMPNNSVFIYSADLNSPTGVTIEVAWQAANVQPPPPPPSTPTSDPTATPVPPPNPK